MKAIPVILIFDVGKTNKKLLLFDKAYNVVYEESISLAEIPDEDGFPGEDVQALTGWIAASVARMAANTEIVIEAINFSAYGASLVFVDDSLRPVLPLYNYLKPFPSEIRSKFYARYGDAATMALETASPALGNLNSGMQLYRIKQEKPVVFAKVRYALHLPQFVSSILTAAAHSDITSIGCHTQLWDFSSQTYHRWVREEGAADKLAPLREATAFIPVRLGNREVKAGIGLHDSSAALIPYLRKTRAPFILISTGTWCISLNPFTRKPLTPVELENDCLCYSTADGNPVKASRLFAGYEHEQQIRYLAEVYSVSPEYFSTLVYNADIAATIKSAVTPNTNYGTAEEAYHALMIGIVRRQKISTGFVLENEADIFVEGGFSKNDLFMNLLAEAHPTMRVYAASMPQASALGAALVLHDAWNDQPISDDLVQATLYPDK